MKCQGCDKEIETGIWCDQCREAFQRFQERERQKLASKVGESVKNGAYKFTKLVCKGIQRVAPVVKATMDNTKRAWNEAKVKKD